MRLVLTISSFCRYGAGYLSVYGVAATAQRATGGFLWGAKIWMYVHLTLYPYIMRIYWSLSGVVQLIITKNRNKRLPFGSEIKGHLQALSETKIHHWFDYMIHIHVFDKDWHTPQYIIYIILFCAFQPQTRAFIKNTHHRSHRGRMKHTGSHHVHAPYRSPKRTLQLTETLRQSSKWQFWGVYFSGQMEIDKDKHFNKDYSGLWTKFQSTCFVKILNHSISGWTATCSRLPGDYLLRLVIGQVVKCHI